MITNFLKFILESTAEKITFINNHLNHSHGQDDYELIAKVNGKIVAYINYAVYKDEVSISFIESIVKHKGYGKAIFYELIRMYGYENITRNSFTDDGIKLRNKIDKELNFDYEQHIISKSKQLKKEIINGIKNSDIRAFLNDLYVYGSSIGFERNLDKIKPINDYLKEYDLDINDISYISDWIIGSKDNDNTIDTDPPEYIFDTLEKITK